jgi:hypothetical protein
MGKLSPSTANTILENMVLLLSKTSLNMAAMSSGGLWYAPLWNFVF